MIDREEGQHLEPEELALMVARGDGMTFRERQRAADLIRRHTASETKQQISGIGMIKLFKDQRDESADVLRRLMAKLREESDSDDPMAPFAYDASWEALAKEADAVLAKCPSYSQQLQNLCDGLGITREQVEEALRVHR